MKCGGTATPYISPQGVVRKLRAGAIVDDRLETDRYLVGVREVE